MGKIFLRLEHLLLACGRANRAPSTATCTISDLLLQGILNIFNFLMKIFFRKSPGKL